jgi:large subunit ribosomal protein L31
MIDMKRLFSILPMLVLAFNLLNAADLRTIFINMPDSVMPLFTKSERMDFFDYMDSGMEQLKIKRIMKKGIHHENYRPVVFKDMSNGDCFLSRSTCVTKETIEFEGQTYPLVKLEISNTSHPFFTGKSKLVDTAGRVDKFMSRYAKSRGKK